MKWRHYTLSALLPVAMVLAGCGQGEEPVAATNDRDEVIEAFATALAQGDVNAMVELWEPELRSEAENTGPIFSAFSSVEPRKEHAVRDLSYEIVSQDESSVVVEYSGELCGPTGTKRFEHSYAEERDSPPTSEVSDGTILRGETVCQTLSEAWEPLSPFKFVRVDGQWYSAGVGEGEV